MKLILIVILTIVLLVSAGCAINPQDTETVEPYEETFEDRLATFITVMLGLAAAYGLGARRARAKR